MNRRPPPPPSPDEIEALYSMLVVDCGLSFDAIAKLTDRQIADVVARPRDEQGRVKPPPEQVPEPPRHLSQKEQDYITLFSTGMALGVPPEELRRAWLAKYPEG